MYDLTIDLRPTCIYIEVGDPILFSCSPVRYGPDIDLGFLVHTVLDRFGINIDLESTSTYTGFVTLL